MSAPIKFIKTFALRCIWFAFAIHFYGCSNSNLPSVSSVSAMCPTGVGGMNADCCNSTGTPLMPPPTSDPSCTVTVPGTAGITNPMQAGAASAGSSLGENANAATLAGSHGAMGTLGQASAATAAPNSAPLNATSGALATPASAPLAASATTSGSGGSSSSDGTGSSVATAPVPTSINPDVTPNAGLSSAAVAAYSGSGGGALLPNGAHETGFHYGNGTIGAIGGASGDPEMAFGAQRNPASSSSIDPNDYFTRIGLQDSLFKKVERRYRSTSASWAMAEVSRIQAAPLTELKKQK